MKKFDAVIFTDYTQAWFVRKPLGAYAIANVLRGRGYQVLVVDHLHTYDLDEISGLLDLCISDKTKFVGFSVGFFASTNNKPYDKIEIQDLGAMNLNQSFFPQGFEFEQQFVHKLQSLNSNCKIVLGGANPWLHQISNRNVDFTIIGFAEISIVALMQHLCTGQAMEQIHSYRNLYGITVIDGGNAEGYPFNQNHMTWLPEDVVNAKVLPIELSRGCIFNCKFCATPLRGKSNNDHLRLTHSTQQELQQNFDLYGVKHYYIMDETFNDNNEKLDQLVLAVKTLNFQPVFWCYARLDWLHNNFEQIDKMYEIGVRFIFFGIETFSKTAGRAIGKGMQADRQIDTIKRIRAKYGNQIVLHGNFIIGLPGETVSSVKNTMQGLNCGDIPLHSWYFNVLKIQKGATHWSSDIDRNYAKYGYRELDGAAQTRLDALMQKEYLDMGGTAGISYMPWQTDTMNYLQAVLLARTHVPPDTKLWSMDLVEYGYDVDGILELDHILKLQPWGQLKLAKVQQYKKQLVDILTTAV